MSRPRAARSVTMRAEHLLWVNLARLILRAVWSRALCVGAAHALGRQQLAEVLGVVLRGHKYHRLVLGPHHGAQQVEQHSSLGVLTHKEEGGLELLIEFGIHIEPDEYRLREARPGKLHKQFGQCGREQDRLVAPGRRPMISCSCSANPISKPVCLIEYHVLHTLQLQVHLHSHVHQTPWSGNDLCQDFHAGLQTGLPSCLLPGSGQS